MTVSVVGSCSRIRLTALLTLICICFISCWSGSTSNSCNHYSYYKLSTCMKMWECSDGECTESGSKTYECNNNNLPELRIYSIVNCSGAFTVTDLSDVDSTNGLQWNCNPDYEACQEFVMRTTQSFEDDDCKQDQIAQFQDALILKECFLASSQSSDSSAVASITCNNGNLKYKEWDYDEDEYYDDDLCYDNKDIRQIYKFYQGCYDGAKYFYRCGSSQMSVMINLILSMLILLKMVS